MATFTAKNFPATENNIRFSGAGERTDYVTCHSSPDGYDVVGAACLFPDGHELAPGTPVWFTSTELADRENAGADCRGVFGEVSLTGPTGPAAGFIHISKVAKPSGNRQSRVAHGALAQNSVAEFLHSSVDYEFVSSAPPGSTAPDLVVSIDGTIQQFEIKGTGSPSAPITLFDKSASRKSYPPLLDRLASIYGTSEDTFVSLMDHYQSLDPSIGFAGDHGVGKSGKLPSEFRIDCPDMLHSMRNVLVDHFRDGGDNYFVVYDRGSRTSDIYFTGHGDNLLGVPDFPMLTQFHLSTYGGPSSGSTRIGLKVKI